MFTQELIDIQSDHGMEQLMHFQIVVGPLRQSLD